MHLQPAAYEPVFFDKPSVGWMLYLPVELTAADVPEAQKLEPVIDEAGRQTGTIVISVADEVFDDANEEHRKTAHAVEIHLADRDLLPRFPL